MAIETVYVCRVCEAVRHTRTVCCPVCATAGSMMAVEREVPTRPIEPHRPAGPAQRDNDDELEGTPPQYVSDEDSEEAPQLVSLGEAGVEKYERVLTGIEGLDYVLGDERERGPQENLALLLGGERGAGKSTMMVAVAANVTEAGLPCIYASSEHEGVNRVRATAARIGIPRRRLRGVHFLDVSRMPPGADRVGYLLELSDRVGAKVLVTDSVNNFAEDAYDMRAVAEACRRFMQFSEDNRVLNFMVAHLNGDKKIAGGQYTQHMGDGCFILERTGIDVTSGDKIVRFYCDGKNRGGWDTAQAWFRVTRSGLVAYDPDEAAKEAARERRAERREASNDARRGGARCATGNRR